MPSSARQSLILLTVCLIAIAAVAPGPLRADEDDDPRRIVHRFHFNERELGNFESMPMNWYRVTEPGFPRYTEIGFDDEHAVAGENSLKIQLNGGSAAITLAAGAIAAVPDAQYLLAGHIRTADARHSRARITAVFLDQDNQPLLDTRTTSQPLRSNDRWTAVQIQPPRTPDDAAWLTIRLELLQPSVFRPNTLGPHDLVQQDIHAAAWFDDLVIYQLPRIELTTPSPTNVIRQPDTPRFNVRVTDLTGEPLDVTLTVRDAAGEVVGQQERTVDPSHPGRWEYEPDLPRLGWYWAELEVYADDALLGYTSTALSYLPQARTPPGEQAQQFMLRLADVPDGHRDLIPQMLNRIGPQAVSLNLWRADMSDDELAAIGDQPDPLVMDLLDDGRPVALTVGEVPQQLAIAAGTDVDRPLDLLGTDPARWEPHLTAAFALYGHRIDQWQIGHADNTRAFWRDDLADLNETARTIAGRYVAEPRIVIPWRATHELSDDSEQLDTLLVDLPVSVRPAQIADYVEQWQDHAVDKIFHLRTLDSGDHPHHERAADLALRMIHLWEHNPHRLALTRPWRHTADTSPSMLPDPVLGVWANVAERLAGRRYVGELNLGPGIEARLFDGAGGGMLVAWNRSSPEADTALDLFLGDAPVAVDIYGNRTPLRPDGQRRTLPLTQTPQFIEDIDMRLARLRAGFKLDEPFIDSVYSEHERTLQITNPWPRTVSGRLRITGPEGWDIQPQLANFSMPADDTIEIPLTITFPASELAGPKRLTARIELEADRTYEVDLAAPMTIGLKNVEVHASASTQPGQDPDQPDDTVVTLVLTNLGEEDQTFYAFAVAPDHPRNERIISNLEPGQTIVRRFRFPASADQLTGESIRVGLREANGPAILNQRVDVPPQ